MSYTVLVDAGDTIQDNSAGIFTDEEVHPGLQWLNKMNYDIWVLGNHVFDYPAEYIEDIVKDFDNTVLTGNLYRKDGSRVTDGYKIIEKDGVRIAFIGMTTHNNNGWCKDALENLKVTDPLDESRKIIDSIEGQYDVLVGVFHLGVENEYGIPHSGVTDICNACPEFDIMVASHEHKEVDGEMINGVLVVENLNAAKSMSVIDIDLKRDGDGWTVHL
jgi:5''-nucleotidase/2'',3''-cyclic phosphodiesterase and related esterases